MNFIEEEMAEGMRFIYPANDAHANICRGNMGAYVWTESGEKDKGYKETPAEGYFLCKGSVDPFKGYCAVDQDGRYFVYLCKAWYERASRSSQISLLIHEAAHHAGPTDVTYDKSQMKKNSQANQLNNAANYQNFALDISNSVELAEPRTSPQACADQPGQACVHYKTKGYCSYDNIKKACAKTCQVCSGGAAPSGCADQPGQACAHYKALGYCSSDHIKEACAKTCSACR